MTNVTLEHFDAGAALARERIIKQLDGYIAVQRGYAEREEDWIGMDSTGITSNLIDGFAEFGFEDNHGAWES